MGLSELIAAEERDWYFDLLDMFGRWGQQMLTLAENSRKQCLPAQHPSVKIKPLHIFDILATSVEGREEVYSFLRLYMGPMIESISGKHLKRMEEHSGVSYTDWGRNES